MPVQTGEVTDRAEPPDDGEVLEGVKVPAAAFETESRQRDARPGVPDTDPSPAGPEHLQAITKPPQEPAVDAPATVGVASANSQLAPYEAFTGVTVPPGAASHADLIDGLVRIVATEGPVVADRAFALYVKAGGGRRVGPQIAKDLTSAVTTAVRRGLLTTDDPLDVSDPKQRTASTRSSNTSSPNASTSRPTAGSRRCPGSAPTRSSAPFRVRQRRCAPSSAPAADMALRTCTQGTTKPTRRTRPL